MAKTKKAPKETPAEAGFTFTVQLGSERYVGKGATLEEAMKACPHPGKIMAKGIVTVDSGTAKRDFLYFPPKLKRLFYSALYQQIQAKTLVQSLKPYA